MNWRISYGWYEAWRNHVAIAKANPSQSVGYQRAAVIAQAEYVMWEATEKVLQGKWF